MSGRELFRKLGEPRRVVAPMVDMSELAWRKLCRKYGAELCYTPMFHAKLFGTNDRYRSESFGPMDGDPATDRPLIVQFCANDPDDLLRAAKHVVGRCDAVDLNLGCPQGIARKGHYGAFLMDEWDTVSKLISKLHKELPELPVTAKIRMFPEREKTLEYAKMVLAAGAQFLGVHARTRDMKGIHTGLADWSLIGYLRENLPSDTVIIANGNIIYRKDIPRCLEQTGADAVMTAETCLANPAIFSSEKAKEEFPRVDLVAEEYVDIVKSTPGKASVTAVKSHLFKLLRNFFAVHTDIRNELGPLRSGDWEAFDRILAKIRDRVNELVASEEDVVKDDGDYYKTVPHWRLQPTFRIVNGVSSKLTELQDAKPKLSSEPNEPSEEPSDEVSVAKDGLKREAEPALETTKRVKIDGNAEAGIST